MMGKLRETGETPETEERRQEDTEAWDTPKSIKNEVQDMQDEEFGNANQHGAD